MSKINFNFSDLVMLLVFVSINFHVSAKEPDLVAKPLEYGTEYQLPSKAMNSDRSFSIALPESYNKSTESAYPVLFVMHGQWETLTTLATLDHLGQNVPEMIVVGVYGASGELFPNRDGTPSGLSLFLTQELLPYIEGEYRTVPFKILSGHSALGRFVMNQWLDNGNTFNSYYAISPAFGDGQLKHRMKSAVLESGRLSPAFESSSKSPLLVTMANEGENEQKPFNQLEQIMSNQRTKAVVFKRYPQVGHMLNRQVSLYDALSATFPNWQPSDAVASGDLETLKQHYKGLSKQVGFEVDVPLETLKRLAVFDSLPDDEQRNKNAINAIRYSIEQSPSNADALFSMADEAATLGWNKAQDAIVSEVCSLLPKHQNCLKNK